MIRKRLALLMASFLALFLILTARLVDLQVVKSESLQKRAQSQWTSEAVIQPRRGEILDRNGSVLAISATSYTASVSPRQVKNAADFARILAPILEMSAETIQARASDTSKGGMTLKRQIPWETACQLKLMLAGQDASALNGLYLEQDSRRYYPNGAFASQLLGLTTIDGVGQSGLESALNNYLSGKAGRVVTEIDGKGRALEISSGEYLSAVDGGSVLLTIDASIQSYCEKAAREAMEVNNAEGVRVLAMNPKTGEILAMVSKPDYDPNDPPRNDVETLKELMRNRVIADAYEPGSPHGVLVGAGITGTPNYLIAIGAGLLTGVGIGALTGLGVTKGRIPPFIITLGVMNIVRSVAQYFTKSYKTEVPKAFQVIANKEIVNGQMLLPIIYWLALAVIMYVISRHTAFGRHIYAVGSNERTSRLSGINVNRVKMKVYMLMGLIVSIAAITSVARLRGVDVASAGNGYEMNAIAAVVVGGTSMAGGRGSIVGTVLGVLIIGIMNNLLVLLHIDAFLSQAFTGAIIIFAVLLQRKDQ